MARISNRIQSLEIVSLVGGSVFAAEKAYADLRSNGKKSREDCSCAGDLSGSCNRNMARIAGTIFGPDEGVSGNL